jgi:hypothetical protein
MVPESIGNNAAILPCRYTPMEHSYDQADLDAIDTLIRLKLIHLAGISGSGEPCYVFLSHDVSEDADEL